MHSTLRTLNDAQHRLLDRIAEADPLARVTGWADGDFPDPWGPVISKADGETVVANVTGRARIGVVA